MSYAPMGRDDVPDPEGERSVCLVKRWSQQSSTVPFLPASSIEFTLRKVTAKIYPI